MHPHCLVMGICSIPDHLGVLEHSFLELERSPVKKCPWPGACISPTLGA